MTIANIAAIIVLVLLGFLVFGSLLNLSSSPHWFIRAWDFPRVQIVLTAWLLVAIFFAIYALSDSQKIPAWPCLVMAVALTLWHGFRILPYTPVMSKQAASTPPEFSQSYRDDSRTLRMVMSNVEMENQQYETWMREMRKADPDLLLVVEVDESWVQETAEFAKDYPYKIIEPNDNWYGMMMLSRLPILDHRVRHLVEEDVPSFDAKIQLDDQTTFRFVGVHPRPPEPIRDNDAKARDAELTLWGTELAEDSGPVVIGGDLNDVAWSQTTRLFLRSSGLLDPRRGRGLFNTFHADHWFMRFPLDHIFHSPHFTVSSIQRLDFVGSDHFPIQIDLRYAPERKADHEVMPEKESDDEEIDLRIDRAVDDQKLQGEAVDEGKREEIKDVDQTSSR